MTRVEVAPDPGGMTHPALTSGRGLCVSIVLRTTPRRAGEVFGVLDASDWISSGACWPGRGPSLWERFVVPRAAVGVVPLLGRRVREC